jgi:hypothetical protein
MLEFPMENPDRFRSRGFLIFQSANVQPFKDRC